jgi:hypothetical protein
MQLTKYLFLPAAMTPFERRYLARLNKVALIFFWLHIPVFMLVAWMAGTGPMRALFLGLLVLAGPTIAYRMLTNPRAISVVYGITAMLMGGLLVHFGQGEPDPITRTPRSAGSVVHGRPVRSLATNREPAGGGQRGDRHGYAASARFSISVRQRRSNCVGGTYPIDECLRSVL